MSRTRTPTTTTTASLTKALTAIDALREKVKELERAKREDIAIVGIGCRLPSGVHGAYDFWESLAEGRDGVREVPASRWDVDAFYDADPTVPGRMPMRYGAFIDGVDEFDPYFFGISPREAARMDPQQRLFLEVAWEALEDAGQTRDALKGSATGVFVGANSSDYLQLQLQDPAAIDTYTIVGGANCIIANRLSYLLDLRGPSMTIDTACSSSLVAVHLACGTLRNRDCSTAVVGGMNLILSPLTTMAHAKGLPLSADGRCKTFDKRADGYARGEGVAAVVLKRASDAIAAGDRIWAVIRGSAVNQDGLTNGLTAPNGRSQRAVIKQALSQARMSPSSVTLLEAHGTGTVLGDPIEVESLVDVYGGSGAGDDDACALGSVKTNVGHLEAGAGLTGLLKVALSISHREIPPNLHLESINPHIELGDSRLFVPTSLTSWDEPDERRNGAVSSFGAGGTNAHVVLGPAPSIAAAQPAAAAGSEPCLIPISAATSDALVPMARRVRDHLETAEGRAVSLRDIAHSATVRRTQHEYRCAVVARTHEEASERLTAWLDHGDPASVVAGRASSAIGRDVVFVFPGQGSQRAGMGRELAQQCPIFRGALEECDEAIAGWLGRSIIDEIHRIDDHAELQGIDLIQPALFAIGVALAARWRSFGIEPAAVVGHSMGEVAAAHVAGALTLEDATRIICRRSALLRRISGQGAMLVVALPMAEAAAIIEERNRDRVSIAVSNSPTSTVLSGEPAALNEIAAVLGERNVFCRPVRVDVASHSPQVDALRDDLLDELSGLAPRAGTIPILSTVTGEPCDGSMFDAAYWVRNLREPVLFWKAIESLVEGEAGIFVEMSPHPVLLSAVEQSFELSGREGLALPSMRREEPEIDASIAGLGALHVNGVNVPLARRSAGGRFVRLPSYAWQHERLWFGASNGPVKVPRPTVVPERVDESPEPARSELLRRVRPANRAARRDMVFEYVRDSVASVLSLDAGRIDPEAGFFQMGMDSMLAAQVRVRIEGGLERRLPAPTMFEHATVSALTDHLVELLDGLADASPGEAGEQSQPPVLTLLQPDVPPQPAESLEAGLSEDELMALLAHEVRDAARTAEGSR
jgi:acyl transferase domain-containing protein